MGKQTHIVQYHWPLPGVFFVLCVFLWGEGVGQDEFPRGCFSHSCSSFDSPCHNFCTSFYFCFSFCLVEYLLIIIYKVLAQNSCGTPKCGSPKHFVQRGGTSKLQFQEIARKLIKKPNNVKMKQDEMNINDFFRIGEQSKSVKRPNQILEFFT